MVEDRRLEWTRVDTIATNTTMQVHCTPPVSGKHGLTHFDATVSGDTVIRFNMKTRLVHVLTEYT